MAAAADERPLPVIEPVPVEAELRALLAACELPVDDVRADRRLEFFGCREDGRLVAVVGLEPAGEAFLLRSLAVTAEARGRGLARRLVAFAEHLVAARDVRSLYLLTTTAADFFRRLGYVDLERERAPRPVRASEQFSRLCPGDAALLAKSLDPG
ncbi:MAG: arsenic resistance N-acetyltransferase ArsN2 [Halofilum sp. (in: g-proteobacteria)]|nr:arsenic resistance N-acetyltransferase ArsN2 [Halofilum sp. (in: g-proteobacteria)]